MRWLASILEIFFGGCRPVRRLLGGHWELWWVDHPVCSAIWHWVPVCSRVSGHRPTGICRGVPTCQHHGSTILTRYVRPAPDSKGGGT